MVFESVAVELVNYVLGDYVENLDTSQLKLGIWGGDINLKDLDIKQSAIDDLDLPFRVAYGHIDKLTLKIPWQSLYNTTYSAIVEGIYLIIVPKSGVKYDAAKEKKLQQEAKDRELARIELIKQQEAERDNPKEEKQDTFMEKLTAQIVKNLQIRVRNIHIRYEDSFTVPKHPMSIGVTLYNLSFDTTDENWGPCVLDAAAKVVHKLVDINSFAFYWNSNSKLFLDHPPSVIKTLLEEKISSEVVKPADVSYILGPISSNAKLTMDTKPELSNYKDPGMTLDILVAEISIGISKNQFRDMLALSESLNRMAIAAHYRKYRPDVPVHGNCKIWWHFAYTAILEEHVRRRRRNWSLQHMHDHVVRVRYYKEQYKLKLQSKETAEELQLLENELDVFNITLARRQAELEVEEQLLQTPKQGWLSSWWYGGDKSTAPSETQAIAQKFEKAMTPAEKQKLYAAIGYQENSVPPEYPVTFVAKKLNFLLKNFSLSVFDESKGQVVIVRVILDDMSASFAERPRADAIKLESKIERFRILGFPESRDFCTLISSENVTTDVKRSLVTFLFEINPLDQKCDQRVHLFAEPVEMIYDSAVVAALADVFRPPEEVSFDKLQAQAVSKLNDIKAMSATGLQHAIEQRKVLELLVDLKPSYLIVFEGGQKRQGKLFMVISFGQLYVHGLPRSRKAPTVQELVRSGSTEDEVLQVMISQAYEKYNVKLTAAEAIICPPGKDWRPALKSGKSDLHVLQPTDIIIDIAKCIVADNVHLPKVKVTGKLPLLRVSVTDFKLVQVLKVLYSIPGMESGSGSPAAPVQSPETTLLLSAESELPTKIGTETALNVLPKSEQSTTSADTVRQDDYESVDVDLNFEVTEVALEISQLTGETLSPVLLFQANFLGLKVEVRPLDMTVQLCLKKTLLQHMLFSAPGTSGPLKILDSNENPGTGNTICLLYTQTNKKHPEFETVRCSVLQKATLDVSELVLVLHEESMSSLLTLSNHMSEQLGSVEAQAEHTASQEMVQATTAKPLGSKSFAAGRRSPSSVVVNMDMFATLSGFTLAICNQSRTICDILVRGVEAGLIMYPTKTIMRMNLKTVGIHDPTPGTVHKDILAIAGDEVLDFDITTYEESGAEGYMHMDRVDIDIKGTFGRMHFVFLYRFYLDIMNFVDKFQAAKSRIAEATASVAEAARAGVEIAYQKAYKMAIDIRIEAPIFYLPQNCKSRNIVVMDFGVLRVRNNFSLDARSTVQSPCLLEDMVVEFDNLKLSRFKSKVPNCDDDFERPLLLPVTFKMHIVRNMNFSAHPEVPEMKVAATLPKVELILSEEDYCAIMRILDENMNELPPGMHPVDPSTVQQPVVTQAAYQTMEEKSSHEHSDPVITSERNIKRAVRLDIAFQIDSVVLDLYVKRNKEVQEGLTRLEIQVFSVKGHMFHDSSYWMDTVMMNLIVDDTRVCRKGGVTRFLTKSNRSKDKLLDILYKVDQSGDFFVQMSLSKMTFVYCVEFFNSLMTFYYLDNMYKQAEDKRQKQAAKPQPVGNTGRLPALTDTTSPPMPPYPARNFTVQLEVDKPDILLVADIDDPQSACIILKSSIHFKLRQVSTTQTMTAVMEELRMFTSCVDKYQMEHVRSEILKPTEISVNSTFTVENGQHMEITFSPIEIHVTAGAVEILSKSLSSLSGPGPEQKSDLVTEPDNRHIWNVKPIGQTKLWFLEERAVQMAAEAMETDVVAAQDALAAHKDEQRSLITRAGHIIVRAYRTINHMTLEAVPLEVCRSRRAFRTSAPMAVRAFLGSVVFCYNEKLAVWEPLVEPIETPTGRKIWEIALRIDKRVVDDEEPITSVDLPALYSIELLVEDTLEVTITQTSLHVMKHLAEAFSEALVRATYDHRRLDTPYVVKNYLGIVVHIILEGTPFKVAAPNVDEDIDEVILEPEAMVQLNFRDTGEEGEERFTGTLVELSRQNVTDATFAIQVKEAGVSAVRKLCVTYADKRYFKLPIKSYPGDDWAFIVDTTSHYGSKLVQIYSVCKVVNNFSIPMEVYYLTEDEGCTAVRQCGVIEPHKVLHLPVRALYTKTNELFFKPAGDKYKVSMYPFVWKSPPEAVQNSVLQCCCKTEPNRFFYINVSGEKEPVKYDESLGKESTMMLYSIQLHPTVLVRNLLPCRLYVKSEVSFFLF
ncbi:unnamed protein product [Ixodes hexagonus]